MTDSSVPRPQPACTPADNTTLSPDERYKDTIALLADVVLQGGIAFQALAARAAPYLEALSALAARIAPYMQALAAHLVDIAEQLRSHQPGPRTCVDDVIIVAAPLAISDDERYQAARRLAAEHLSLRYVYLSSPGLQARWSVVRPAFVAYCREHGLSPEQAWEQLVVPIVYDVAHRDSVRHAPLDAVRQVLAREVRKEVERELLGRTADEKDPADVRYEPDPDVPEEWAALRLDVVLELARLDPLDRLILVKHYVEGCDYRTLAEELGMSEGAVRVRAHRALVAVRSRLDDAECA
jgi:RNA polymerase sigma factor (sigma-70 family)